jgi:hypothetical protein
LEMMQPTNDEAASVGGLVLSRRGVTCSRLPRWPSPPLHASQALSRRSLLPIRARVCADDPADGADHSLAEGWNRDRIAERIDVHQGLVVAELARHGERAHAVLPHVGERHRRTAVAILGHAGTLTQRAL